MSSLGRLTTQFARSAAGCIGCLSLSQAAWSAGISALLMLGTAQLAGYPLDGYEKTRIRRLLAYRLALDGKIETKLRLPSGCLLDSNQVVLRLKGVNEDFDINAKTPRDPGLQAGLEKVFAAKDPSYNIALLDITDPRKPRYAALRADQKRIPGSVGKLLVATGFFDALRRIHPADTAARGKLLLETTLTADRFVHRDGKTVPFFNEGDSKILRRRLDIGDQFNLWEWLDHMLSVSSNASASMVWKEAIMLRHFARRYPARDQEAAFLKETSKPELHRRSMEVIEDALQGAGLDTNKLRIGTFFTRNASSTIPGTGSYASPNELMRWLIKVEQGKLVDSWSSLEIKKLIYFSRRRYRYASSPALNQAAVFFKSGSLFKCEPEPGFKCKAYAGNKLNLMHSVAVIESKGRVYLVTMMSNILRKNSAVEHQSVATEIERLIQSQPKPTAKDAG